MTPDPEKNLATKAQATGKPAAGDLSRDDRRKAALKANLARRKAQAKARGAEATAEDSNEN